MACTKYLIGLSFALPWQHCVCVTGVSSTCTKAATTPCGYDGSSATYTEAISGDVREIVAGGCPNNNPHTPCINSNPSESSVQNWVFNIPATPKFIAADYASSLSSATELKEVGGLVGVTINGIEIRSCYGGTKYGICTDYDTSATNVEGDTFDYCGGHGNPYHYHQAPTCLINQIGDRTDGSSPHVGWAADGFPIYGNKGPGGVLIKACGADGADATYCADTCGGYYGSDYNDDFLYRYFMMGPDGDMETNPSSPTPGSEYFPFVLYCLVGCGEVTATGTDRTPTIGKKMQACTDSSAAGTADGYTASATTGVTTAYDTEAALAADVATVAAAAPVTVTTAQAYVWSTAAPGTSNTGTTQEPTSGVTRASMSIVVTILLPGAARFIGLMY